MRKGRLVGGLIAGCLAIGSFIGVPEMVGIKNESSITTVSAASYRAGLYIVQKHGFSINGRYYSVGSYVSVSTSGAINGVGPGVAQIFIITGQIAFVRS
ncbi:MAG: hypothetical protein IKK88_07190 [Oscillospiraceae bacterium]|nr:hypothetical protein [Oscillospiraceae bacterium]